MLLDALGRRGDGREWWRAARPPRTPVHAVQLLHEDDDLERLADLLEGRAPPPGLPAAAAVERRDRERAVFTWAYRPGLLLDDALVQTQQERASLPIEIACTLAFGVARALGWLVEATAYELPELDDSRVFVGFDGRVTLLDLPRPIDSGPEGESIQSCASFLYWLLRGSAPDRGFLEDRAPAPSDGDTEVIARPLPPPIERVIRDGLVRPLEVFGTCDRFARAVAARVTPDPSATGAWLAALFPEAMREDEAFLEELPMRELTEVVRVGTVRERPVVEGRWLLIPSEGDAPMFEAASRLVTNAQVIRFLEETGREDPRGWFGRDPALADAPAVLVDHALALALASWHGARLPTEDEWVRAARGGGPRQRSLCGLAELCELWEWTATEHKGGHVVRGGPWRNRAGVGLVDHKSWEDEAAADLGVRLVRDV